MSAVSKFAGLRWVSRVVDRDSVVIAGRTYRPLSGDVAYTDQLDGYRCLFAHYIREGQSYSRSLALYGVWDPDEQEYLALQGPHVVGDRFVFVEWMIDEDQS